MIKHINKELDGTYTVKEYPDVEPIKVWDEFGFRNEFTRQERKAIMAATKVSEDIADFEAMLQAAGRTGTRIKSGDPLLREAMLSLEGAGLLTEARRKEILGI